MASTVTMPRDGATLAASDIEFFLNSDTSSSLTATATQFFETRNRGWGTFTTGGGGASPDLVQQYQMREALITRPPPLIVPAAELESLRIDVSPPVQTAPAAPPRQAFEAAVAEAQTRSSRRPEGRRSPFTRDQQDAIIQAVKACRSVSSRSAFAAMVTAAAAAISLHNRRFSTERFRDACYA